MSRKSASSLSSSLIARKGEAAPAVTAAAAQGRAGPSSDAAAPTPVSGVGEAPRGLAGTIAVTVRLDPERYERLKIFGVHRRRTNQDIMVAALDAYLSANT